jgi:nucleotide-binding universal stress UspA family protein
MFSNILVGIDGRSGGRSASALAGLLADANARFTLAHVYGTTFTISPRGGLRMDVDSTAPEAMLAEEAATIGLAAERVVTAASTVARGLHELADRREADLVAIGSCHRSAFGRVVLGDDTEATLHGARFAVTVAPQGYTPPKRLREIGLGHDGSPEADASLIAARVLAARHEAAIRALSVISLDVLPRSAGIPRGWPKLAGELVTAEAHRLSAIDGVDGDAVYGEPGEELARFSEQLDLLIVGSRGYGPLGRRLAGSTSGYLARHAHCPLLVLPRDWAQAATPTPAQTPAGITP